MAQILAVALGAVSLFLALRWVNRDIARVSAALDRVDQRVRRTEGAGKALVLEANRGYYRLTE